MDTSLSEESIPEVIAKQSVLTINIFIMDQCDQMSLENKETDAFLDESQKDQRPQILDSITQPYNSTSSKASANSNSEEVPSKEKIAQLCDKAFDAGDKANQANQEKILCCLRKKTQRAKKIYKFIEQVGLDKIKYIKSYSATSISKLTNEQIQEVIDYGIFSEKLLLVTDHVTEISETSCSRKNLPKNTPSKTEEFQNNQISALIPSTHNSNSSNNSSGTSPVQMISPATPQASVSPISIPRTNPTYNRSYFCNKTLDQYPNV
ncbi:hypothetical protein GLOIN_2v1770898 [Rhizophagus irregularis DAOM 181602=DAOM 197198]|uniref:Uncharacterized protein n=1 Tax=Rhizophagus irregularis (strain DAOM 181602 / DAOM 197198 / MUCL 43194) TaxID=747089 RepID=A0A2P4QB31_RHIID|nr:hypothetical protein GLOIN_2v1770898 [Rhizophagus irregularis DAOM 181602=DAOM 197198]POG74843.1 hypothetical protein GLOIN_2v1770898 [Rhizophagus irregularis DAOM 181602=DAOM 197198]|eukprot:XP_025181709.1 hypothetical protein GLOIN_2v1770898 [Rhizophagus irregularis DAOM 181602=DAOM 197198]